VATGILPGAVKSKSSPPLRDLAEVRLAVDELQDLHEVLGKRGRSLVDLRDAFRGLGENRCLVHPTPRGGFLCCDPGAIMA
jgi:hypothetical protein